MSGDALAAMEHLDRARADANVRPVGGSGCAAPNRRSSRSRRDSRDRRGPAATRRKHIRQRAGDGATDARLPRTFAPADAKPAHRALVHLPHRLLDRGVALGEREEGEVTQPAENVGLGKAHPRFRLSPCRRGRRGRVAGRRPVTGRHPAVGAVDLGGRRTMVYGHLPGQVSGTKEEPGTALEKPEHTDMRADPVGQRLCPARLGISVVRGADNPDEDLRRVDLAGELVDDRVIVLPE